MFLLYICTAIWLFSPFFSNSDAQISHYVLNISNTKRFELHIYACLHICFTFDSNTAVDSLYVLLYVQVFPVRRLLYNLVV